MSKQPAIIVDNVSMKFNLSKEKVDSLKDYIIKSIKKEIKYNEFWALQNVSFTVEKGDRVGILGLNGAGKSTLLKVIAGVFKPTEGSVTKHGKMVPLLELGAGFDPQYTGKENIYLYGAMLGYSKEFIDEKYDEIVKFSELKDFIDVPIKNYSSGMKSRLGFSIATVVSPKILILDEVLSVGDAKFRKKSEKKVLSMFDSDVLYETYQRFPVYILFFSPLHSPCFIALIDNCSLRIHITATIVNNLQAFCNSFLFYCASVSDSLLSPAGNCLFHQSDVS